MVKERSEEVDSRVVVRLKVLWGQDVSVPGRDDAAAAPIRRDGREIGDVGGEKRPRFGCIKVGELGLLDAHHRRVGVRDIVPHHPTLVVVAQATDVPGHEKELTKRHTIH
jgi:hypothetical protein